jgi:hypothetical protein
MPGRIVFIALTAVIGISFVSGAATASGTRQQHREWMRKLETPGGTFAGLVEASPHQSEIDLAKPTRCHLDQDACSGLDAAATDPADARR